MIKFKPGVSFGDFVVTDVMTKQPREKTEMPIDYRRGLVVWLVVLAAMGLLLMRLGSLQLITGGKYRVLSDENRIKKIRIAAPRGKILDRNGQDLRLLGDAAGHVVGYLGEINEQEVGLLREQGQKYEIGSQIGRSGLEQEYEDQLRGIDGGQLVEVDPHQEVVRNLGKSDPKPGKDLQTSLDANLQTVAYTALAGRKGAVVVANPKTGEILALVSSPGFDPQNIKKSLSDTSMPLLNRAIGGIYPPGSTFKMVTTIAALMEKKADKNFTYDDKGVINIGSFAYTNWYFNQYGKTEGVVGWEKALARSVDTFFYKVGEMVGPDLMAAWAKDLGMGEKTKIDLPGEVTGLIPTPAWKEKFKNEKWFLGNTYHMAIGQGDVLTTPIQVNVMTNVIAAGGKKCVPHLNKALSPQCSTLKIDNKILEIVKRGMIGACSKDGTAFPLFDFKPQVACKTGTAEYILASGKTGTHAWLTAYAPAEDPTVSVTVLVEGGGEGSRVAAPIARKVLVKYFGVEDKFNYAAVSGVGE